MQTIVKKNQRGNWEARSEMPLGANNRVLSILTSKDGNGRLRTFASVARKSGHFLEHQMFQDFSEVLFSVGLRRVTEAAVRAQHESVDLLSLVERARSHYA